MRQISSFACLVALAGCATAAPSLQPGASAPPRIIESGGSTQVFISTDSRPAGKVVPGTRDTVWPALIQAYQELGIPVTTIDQTSGILGNRSHDLVRRFSGKQLSHFFSCGSNLSGEVANSARVTADILSQIRPQDGGVMVETRVLATARPNEGTSTNPINCTSTGRLEELITRTVEQRAAG